MSDIQKTIERLKELEAEASPGPWFDGYALYPENITLADAAMIKEMRNALPELLQKLQRLEKFTEDDWEGMVSITSALFHANERADKAEADRARWKARAEALQRFIRARHRVICFGCQFWEKAQGGYWCDKDCDDYERWVFDEARFKEGV